MRLTFRLLSSCLRLSVVVAALIANGSAADLATAPPEELLGVYSQLRHLTTGDQWAAAERVSLKRDAGTFTFIDGRLAFAVPVAGRVLAAVFEGRGTFELNPPTQVDQRQLARFT